jgi:hypothetical protein
MPTENNTSLTWNFEGVTTSCVTTRPLASVTMSGTACSAMALATGE